MMIRGRNTTRLGAVVIFVIVATFAVGGCDSNPRGSISASGKSKTDFGAMAAVSMTDAIVKAQAKYPGKAVRVELETEKGDLVYKVEIVGRDNSLMELAVDAGNGAILSMKRRWITD